MQSLRATLAAARTEHPELALSELKSLLCLALNKTNAWLIAHDDEPMMNELSFKQLVARRTQGEPMAYLRGRQEFYGRDFMVNPDVLIPRPETEHLIDQALNIGHDPIFVLDLCTGSGIIAITLAKERPNWTIAASDISQPALRVAKQNAALLDAQVNFSHSDLFKSIAGHYHLITANPPYIAAKDQHLLNLKFEPQVALTDDEDGLSLYRRLAREAPNYLHPNGQLIIEHGYDQAQAIQTLFSTNAWRSLKAFHDLAGHVRGAVVIRTC